MGGPVVAGIAAGVGWPVLLSALVAFARAFEVYPPHLDWLPAAFLISEVLVVSAAALLTRDVLLIRAIRGRIDLARCTKCGQSLLGLPLLKPTDVPLLSAAVRCPECGSIMELVRLGLVPADLIPRERRT